MRLFAVCIPGLEPCVAQELRQLGLLSHPPPQETIEHEDNGGIEFDGSILDVYRGNLHLRTASRILVRMGSFYAVGFPELCRKTRNLPWDNYLSAETSVAIRVTCHASRLYHERAVSERIATALSDRLGKPVLANRDAKEIDSSPQLILIRLLKDQCTISLDSSGQLLHQRGYRLATAKAPLRETLAAAMLLASGWDRVSPILDPFCGSGTIAIEAALLARRIPPGKGRRFAFMDWPSFSDAAWQTLLAEAPATPQALPSRIIASDRDRGAIRSAIANADRAGVVSDIDFSSRPISSIAPPSERGWIVTNPPYGVRTQSSRDLRNLYARFGAVLQNSFPGWRVTMLCSSLRLLHQTGIRVDKVTALTNGGIKVKLINGGIR